MFKGNSKTYYKFLKSTMMPRVEFYLCFLLFLANLNDSHSATKLINSDKKETKSESSTSTGIQVEKTQWKLVNDGEEIETVLKLTEYALSTLDDLDGEHAKRVLYDVVNAKKMFSHGLLYNITALVLKETDMMSKKQQLCKLQVLRSWASDNTPYNAQVVHSECSDVEENDEINSGNSKVRRSVEHTMTPIANSSHSTSFEFDEKLKVNLMFDEYIQKYNKRYKSEEEKDDRRRIFRSNYYKMKLLQESDQGTAMYGMTEFADLTKEEFRKYFLGYKGEGESKGRERKYRNIVNVTEDIKLPNDFDWRNYNAVTAVKNQGMCGSCWAFSVTGNVEGQWYLKHNKLLSLSEQELIDCDALDDGCEGGYMTNAYESITKLGGLETEQEYPYEAVDDKCKFDGKIAQVKVISSVNITSNETQMAQWLVKNGPISIAINANAMQFYFGGVSHPPRFLCEPEDLDHGVLIVGFGTHTTRFLHKQLPYWLIKNSWGKGWGEHGYYKIYRGSGACGVNQQASSAIVA